MADETLIAWTDHTFNPWMGCTKVSDGCKHCYAETLTKNRMGLSLWGFQAPRQRTNGPWQHVRRWEREAATGQSGLLGRGHPQLVFTGSLMDWAEEHADLDAWRRDLFALIRDCPHLHFQLLTKRPERIQSCLPPDWAQGYPNVWLGTSIEDARVGHRADALRAIPAVVRFVSYEPALGPLNELDLTGIDWIIYGGESGPGWRAEHKDWARVMYRKCRDAEVAFFHKQSAGYRTELGIDLDGIIVRQFPTPRQPDAACGVPSEAHAAAARVA